MSTSLKLKTLWLSMFQPQNSFIVQKSMKSVDGSLNDGRDEYRRRREKNNESVRKSRAKNRMIVQECAQSVQELKNENVILTKQLATLQDELVTLKGLFQHCFSFNLNNLSIKPNDIPTSALYNIIMKKDMKTINNSAAKNV